MNIKLTYTGAEKTIVRTSFGGEKIKVKPGGSFDCEYDYSKQLCEAYPEFKTDEKLKDQKELRAKEEEKTDKANDEIETTVKQLKAEIKKLKKETEFEKYYKEELKKKNPIKQDYVDFLAKQGDSTDPEQDEQDKEELAEIEACESLEALEAFDAENEALKEAIDQKREQFELLNEINAFDNVDALNGFAEEQPLSNKEWFVEAMKVRIEELSA